MRNSTKTITLKRKVLSKGKRNGIKQVGILFCLFLSLNVFAQEEPLSPRIEFFSIPNSPINAEEISDIKIDNQGYVWVVSFKGLYRFDGEKFQKISANYNSFGSLIRFYQGTEGERFVIDYWGGIYLIDNDSLFEYPHNSIIRSYYKSYGYSDIFLENKKLHFAFHSSGYKTIEEGKVEDPLADKGIFIDGFACRLMENRLPFIFRRNIKKRIKNQEKEQPFYLFGNDFQLIDSAMVEDEGHHNPSSIVQLPNGNYLFSSGKGNLIEFNEESVISTIDYESQIINLFVDDRENLWISTRNEGVHYYEDSDIKKENRTVILPNSTTIISAQDYQGGIWLYSLERGIGYISHPEIKFFLNKKRVRPLVEALTVIDDKIVYADESQLKSISLDESLKMESIVDTKEQIMRLSLDEKANRLWISTRGSLCYLEDGELKKPSFTGEGLHSSFSYFDSDWEDSEISLVATNDYQYFICDDTSITYISKQYEHKLKGVLLTRDTVYLNTGNGIYMETPDSTYYLGDRHEIATKFANQLILFNNQLILSIPSEGVYVFNGKNFEPLTYNDEVVPNAKLVQQDENTLWAISNYGCFRISTQTGGYQIEAFQPLPRIVIKSAIIRNDKLFIQTRNSGIGIIELEELGKNRLLSPELLITRIQTKNDLFYKEVEIAPLPHDENSLQLSFKSLNYHGLDVLYRFKFKDSEEEWTTTTTGFVNFVSLEPNTYEFVVQSRFGLGEWSESKSIHFEIVPPFWKRWWFIVSASAVILLLSYRIVTYRFRIINKEKSLIIGRLTAEQKSLRAKMDPHFMFNIISSVQYLILRKENKKATQFLNQFSSLLRNTLNQSDMEYISIEDEIKFLKEYIDLEKMRLEDKFDYNFSTDELVNKEQRIPTFILQPFVENAIHHGLKGIDAKGHLKLSFASENSVLKITIEDDGIGYNSSLKAKNKKRVSHGIQTIKDRLKIYNGNHSKEPIEIQDLSEIESSKRGTRVTVTIKIKKV